MFTSMPATKAAGDCLLTSLPLTAATAATILAATDLRVDANRDEWVDVRGALDESGPDAAIALCRALFHPDKRCPFRGGKPLGDKDLAVRNHASGSDMNGAADARGRYVAPRQRDLGTGRKDIFTQPVTGACRTARTRARWIDDWYIYHLGTGEAHCGTDTLRDPSTAWWRR